MGVIKTSIFGKITKEEWYKILGNKKLVDEYRKRDERKEEKKKD